MTNDEARIAIAEYKANMTPQQKALASVAKRILDARPEADRYCDVRRP